ncbi:MAG TPA: hypothetical protein VLK26_05420 [Rudaea sp.]|nr:hypothetical protein [Rudaea sp.]
MHTFASRLSFAALLLLLVCRFAAAQTTTETFESSANTTGATTFTSQGKTFTINSIVKLFSIDAKYAGTGWSGTAADNKYIDNDNNATQNSGVDFSIKTQDASKFSVRSFWLYLSDYQAHLGASGSVTIVGKLGGAVKFTAGPVSIGFNSSINVSNGFSLIDLANFGGTNHSHVVIDELEVQTAAHFEYIALDALTWTLLDDQIFASEFE